MRRTSPERVRSQPLIVGDDEVRSGSTHNLLAPFLRILIKVADESSTRTTRLGTDGCILSLYRQFGSMGHCAHILRIEELQEILPVLDLSNLL